MFPALGFPAGFLLGFEMLALVSAERTEEGGHGAGTNGRSRVGSGAPEELR